jgi:hypothetical protein
MSFTPKKIYVNGNIIPFVQSSFKVKGGYGETTTRVQVSGRTVLPVPAQNLETNISEASFDLITQDLDSDADPRILIKTWKSNPGANILTFEPDGAGQTQQIKSASLMNDPEVMETPDGNISLTWQGSTITLTN